MSSLRNAVKRSTHKERAQPAARKHLGLLEKHSDYKKRADDYKKKTARLKTLTRKAAERNQDEFYFAMTKTVAGERRGPAGANSTHAATAKLKAEDLRYVHMRKVVDDRRVEGIDTGDPPALRRLVEERAGGDRKQRVGHHDRCQHDERGDEDDRRPGPDPGDPRLQRGEVLVHLMAQGRHGRHDQQHADRQRRQDRRTNPHGTWRNRST